MKKKLILFSMLFISTSSFAQNTVFKCVDSEGNISYVNKEESAKCKSTNLGFVDKSSTLNKSSANNGSSTPSAEPNFTPNTNTEQIIRDKKRLLILKNELTQEIEQRKTIESMLSKIPPNLSQSEEYQKLNNLLNNHKKNIESLEKEIVNISKSIPNESIVNNNVGIPSNIAPPIALPNNLNMKIDPNVQLVSPPETKTPLMNTPKIEIPKTIPKSIPEITQDIPKENKPSEPIEEKPIKEVFNSSFITNKSLNKNNKIPNITPKNENSKLLILPLEKK